MKERFLFDRVYIGGTDLVIDKRIKYSVEILPHCAVSAFAVGDHAPPTAKIAAHQPSGCRLPQDRLF